MQTQNAPTHKLNRNALLWIGLTVTLIRIIYLFLNQRDLDIEESQYWTWSQHLALGYHSKPPMISWAIYLSTQLFGNSEASIRLLSPLTYLISSLFLYISGKILYNESIGFWAGVTVLLLPGVTYSGTIISTDPLLLMFWCAALCAFIKGSQKPKQTLWWLICGISIGLGLLSKYTMLFFFPCMIIYFIISIENHSLWKKPGPYIAFVTALIVFFPNILWNAQNHNPAAHHVIEHNIHLQNLHFNLKNLTVFIVGQIGILGPLIFIFFVAALLRSNKRPPFESTRLLISFSLPVLLIFCAEALLSRAYANWAVVAYPSGIVLTAAYMYQNNYRSWLKINVVVNSLIALTFYAWELSLVHGYHHWPLPNHPNWKDYGHVIQTWERRYPNTLYLVDNRELWSKTLYYGRIPKERLFVWDPQNSIDWLDEPGRTLIPPGEQFVMITYQNTLPFSIAASFQQALPLPGYFVNQRLLGKKNYIYFYSLLSK